MIRAQQLLYGTERTILKKQKINLEIPIYMKRSQTTLNLLWTSYLTLWKIFVKEDVCTDTLNYFLIKDAKFARFCLLPKIHERLYNVPGRPVISNCGYYIENISSFLDFHLQPIAINFKSNIKDTNDFLKTLHSITNLPGNSLVCTTDVVGLYPNILYDEGLSVLRKRLKGSSGRVNFT